MPKKRGLKRKRANKPSYQKVILIFAVLLLAFVVILKISQEKTDNMGVLGLLAKGGDDSSGSESSESGSSGSSYNSGSGSSGSDDSGGSGSSGGSDSSGSDSSGSSSGSGSSGSSSGSSGSFSNGSTSGFTSSTSNVSVASGALVDCVGPDGKTFRTNFEECQKLNNSWGNSNFQFKLVSSGESVVKVRPTEVKDRQEIAEVEEELEIEDENGVRVRATPEKTEIKISETERIRAITKDGRTRIDITSGGVKTRLEVRDGRVIIKAENEDGSEEELADDTIFKIDDRLSANGIKVATSGAQGFLVQRGAIAAQTEFPLSIDLATNTLLINTPSGQKEVAVLPDQAVQNLIGANIINSLIQNDNLDVSNISSVNSVIALGEKEGIPVYQITGVSNQKLLGFIPIKVEKIVTVSADTGEVISTQTHFIDRVIEVLSI